MGEMARELSQSPEGSRLAVRASRTIRGCCKACGEVGMHKDALCQFMKDVSLYLL